MLKFLSLVAIAISFFSAKVYAADKYEFDKEHTAILFYVNHLGFSEIIGEFTDYDGFFIFDPKKPEDSSVDVTLRPSGIRTSSSALDSDLQGDKFFKSDEFPTIHFVSRKIKPKGAKIGEIYGDLTLLGITKPATLIVRFNKADYHPITKNFIAGFSASAKVKRSDFGMAEYVPMVGDVVRIEVQTEGINIDQKAREALKRK